MLSSKAPSPKQGPEFEEWIEALAEYLKSRRNTNMALGQLGQNSPKYDSISLSNLSNDNLLWRPVSNQPLNDFVARLNDCLMRGAPASPFDIPRSDTTPLWLCNRKLHNGAIPVPEDLRWYCVDTNLGVWVWYGWYEMMAPIIPSCAADFCSKLCVYSLSDWGDAAVILKKFRPPMFESDEEVLWAARRAASDGYDIAKVTATVLAELGFETLRQKEGFVKWNYRDWATVSFIDSKGFPAFSSLEWDYAPNGIGEACGNLLRITHDITDYIGDVVHGECSNARVQHDLSCSRTGCTWSELNRLTAQINATLGRQWVNHFMGTILWWKLAMGRYHFLPKLCYAVRHCKIPEPTDCPWTGHPAHPVFFEIPPDSDPVSGPEVCRRPCVEIEDWPESLDSVVKLVERAFQQMYDPTICYECALKMGDRLEGSLQRFPPRDVLEYCQRNMSWIWEGPVLSLLWKALGHMSAIIPPRGFHDERACGFT